MAKNLNVLDNLDHKSVVGSVPALNLFSGKLNKNLMIVGQSGAGKSELSKYLITALDGVRFVFSFKPRDAYLSLPYSVLDVAHSLPDCFSDANSFVEAYKVAFPINMTGITASQIPSLLLEAVSNSSNFPSFFDYLDALEGKFKGSSSSAQAVSVIRSNCRALYDSRYPPKDMPFVPVNTVYDFSGLNEVSKTFYSEFLLRFLWSNILKGFSGVTLVVDEVHRLTRSPDSIVPEVLREIRAFGSFWVSTQNYSDIDISVSSQFSTVLTFRSFHSDDIKAFSSYGFDWSEVIPYLPPYCFSDVRSLTLSGGAVFYSLPALKSPASVKFSVSADSGRVWRYILKHGVVPESDLVSHFKRFDAVSVVSLLDVRSVECVPYGVVYFPKRKDALHEWIVDRCVDRLRSWGVVFTLTHGNRSSDILTDYCNIEVETGRKNDLHSLDNRVLDGKSKVLIVVPNERIKARYLRRYGRYAFIRVVYLSEIVLDDFLAK